MSAAPPLELWGGVECTVVRIGDEFRDQVVDTGHASRLSDLDAMAKLGVKAVRYPIVWESVAPESPYELDFSWHDRRLERLRELGIRVIGGLVHHGSGPRYASMLDDKFAPMLGNYAATVARRYPWIDMWTPVNEPLTTARFSCLYGHWFPHERNLGAMFRGLVNECHGTLLAMRAIRRVIPHAQLLVTEDLGKTFATDRLAYQAEHENRRRWLSFDLLAGRVDPDHHFYRPLLRSGAPLEVIEELATGEATPDVIGINHYLTSERFLDHRVGRYPDLGSGSNGRDTYVDAEAVRVSNLKNQIGPAKRLREAWERYGIPMAYTEVHHGCTREEQVRWLVEVWKAVENERRAGADIRAVTLWSMFGALDWRSLLTRRDGIYDVGAFDTRSPKPRPTLVAKAAATLGRGEKFDHPLLDLPGWWRRPGRCNARRRFDTLPRNRGTARPLLITGATGTLGRAFARICAHRGLRHVLTSRAELDITDETSIAAALDRFKPWAIINTAGFVRVAEAETLSEECFRINATGPEMLGRAARLHGIPLVTFSSDLVFDGKLGRSYVEPDATAPTNEYGRSKAEAEARLLEVNADALIVRTSAFFGPWDRYNFLFNTVETLQRGETVVASDNNVVSPTYVPDLVHATLDLLLDEEKGIWHLTNQGAISWHDLACEVADFAKASRNQVRPADDSEAADTSLSSKRGILLRPLQGALGDFFASSEPLRQISCR
ncbi:MAG: sugar nucleotide-binding protein [Pseudomonadota bacterium]|nr:sugar nucleotide-binding protein [Pseudomonadota bacterium]